MFTSSLLLIYETIVNLENDWVNLVFNVDHFLFWSLINHHTKTANNKTKTIIITLNPIFSTANHDLIFETVVFVWIRDATSVSKSQHASLQQPLLQLNWIEIINFFYFFKVWIYLINQICAIITIHLIFFLNVNYLLQFESWYKITMIFKILKYMIKTKG